MTNGQIELVPKMNVSAQMNQKCRGGLCVNGSPWRVGRKNAPSLISRTTCEYLVSSPT